MYRYLLIFLFILPLAAKAQRLKGNSFTWRAQQVQDLKYDTLRAENGTFISYGLETFEMVQHSNTFTFTVTSYQGVWNDVSQPGQIVFSVTINNAAGTITTGRDATGLYLVLDMTPSSPDSIKTKYFISSLTLL